MNTLVSKFLSVMLLLAVSISVNAADTVSPVSVDGTTAVNATQSKDLFDKGALFLDVRSNKDWDAGRIPDAVHIELKKKFSEASMSSEVKKDEPVVIYCNGPSCLRSSKAAAMAVAWGFTKVYYFRDGYPAWKSAGYPTE